MTRGVLKALKAKHRSPRHKLVATQGFQFGSEQTQPSLCYKAVLILLQLAKVLSGSRQSVRYQIPLAEMALSLHARL